MSGVLGVETDLLSDVEVGCEIFSKTVQEASGWAGGVVAEINITGDGTYEFTCIRIRHGNPYLHCFEGSDVRMEHTKFTTRMARETASFIHTWLGRRDNSRMDRSERVRWSGIAQRLDEVSIAGLYLPHAEARYRAGRKA